MSTIYFGGLSIKLFIGVSPLYVSEGCPQNYLSEYVLYLFRRLVHKTIYRSKSTICIGGLSTKIIYRSMYTIYFEGLSIKLLIGVSPLYVSKGCPQNYLSEYVHYLFRRVVHKTIYRSKFTICIGGLSTKQLFIGVSPLYVLEGCPQNYLSEYVHYLFRRVVHKTIYRNKSTICIGGLFTKLFIGVCPLFISEGCPQVKQISLF